MKMGKTSAKVRNDWNRRNYDRIEFTVPKGMKEKIYAYARERGIPFNQLMNMLLRDEVGILAGEWGFAVGYNPYLNEKAT